MRWYVMFQIFDIFQFILIWLAIFYWISIMIFTWVILVYILCPNIQAQSSTAGPNITNNTNHKIIQIKILKNSQNTNTNLRQTVLKNNLNSEKKKFNSTISQLSAAISDIIMKETGNEDFVSELTSVILEALNKTKQGQDSSLQVLYKDKNTSNSNNNTNTNIKQDKIIKEYEGNLPAVGSSRSTHEDQSQLDNRNNQQNDDQSQNNQNQIDQGQNIATMADKLNNGDENNEQIQTQDGQSTQQNEQYLKKEQQSTNTGDNNNGYDDKSKDNLGQDQNQYDLQDGDSYNNTIQDIIMQIVHKIGNISQQDGINDTQTNISEYNDSDNNDNSTENNTQDMNDDQDRPIQNIKKNQINNSNYLTKYSDILPFSRVDKNLQGLSKDNTRKPLVKTFTITKNNNMNIDQLINSIINENMSTFFPSNTSTHTNKNKSHAEQKVKVNSTNTTTNKNQNNTISNINNNVTSIKNQNRLINNNSQGEDDQQDKGIDPQQYKKLVELFTQIFKNIKQKSNSQTKMKKS